VNDLLALGDALGLPTLNLVGHSLGARIALMLAAVHSARVSKLVLVDGGGKPPADALETVAASIKRIGQVYPSLDAFMEERQQTPVHQWNAYWEQLYRYDVEVRPDGTAASRMPKHVLDEENAVNYFLRSEALPDLVRAPTLIVRAAVGTLGADRGFILPAEEAERMRSVIPDCRIVVIPDTNHYTVVLPDAFNQELPAFLGG
jgi:lipase